MSVAKALCSFAFLTTYLTHRIIDETSVFIFKNWRHLLWPGDLRRIKKNLGYWASCISNKIGAKILLLCFGFLDGTKLNTCRPGGHDKVQEVLFDGHHRQHAISFHGITAPDGTFVHFFGPFSGNRTDEFMYGEINLEAMWKAEEFTDDDGKEYFVYADCGYTSGYGILAGWKEATGIFRRSNYIWSKQRISVEWGFGAVKSLWKMLSFRYLQKPQRSRVSVWYLVCIILTNCHMCLHRSQASLYFDCKPPNIEEYLHPRDAEFDRAFEKYKRKSYPMAYIDEVDSDNDEHCSNEGESEEEKDNCPTEIVEI